jgi:hypothetical protein
MGRCRERLLTLARALVSSQLFDSSLSSASFVKRRSIGFGRELVLAGWG